MNEIQIKKIKNGYTIYFDYKHEGYLVGAYQNFSTEFVKTKDEVIEYVKKAIKTL